MPSNLDKVTRLVSKLPPMDMKKPAVAERNRFFSLAFRYLAYNGIGGDYAEFGSASAKTFRLAYNNMTRVGLNLKMWSFDSFSGLPPKEEERDAHPRWGEGNYAMRLEVFRAIVRAHGIPEDRYETIEGFYGDTIGARANRPPERLPDSIALAYVDCDLYSSTRDVLHFLGSRLKSGMIVAFDDYYCFTDGQVSGERLALIEFLTDHPKWSFLPYLNIFWGGQAFIIEPASE